MEIVKDTQEKKLPKVVGISGKPDSVPQITWQDFFAFKQSVSQMLDFLTEAEQHELEKGNLKYFTEDDLEEKKTTDKNGKEITYKDLKDSFWAVKPKSLIITPDQLTITPQM